jgi:hypothetical protein
MAILRQIALTLVCSAIGVANSGTNAQIYTGGLLLWRVGSPEAECTWLVTVGSGLIGLACWARRRNTAKHR